MECILDCTFSLDVGMYEQAGKSEIVKAEEAAIKSMQIIRECKNEVSGEVGGRERWLPELVQSIFEYPHPDRIWIKTI